MSDDSSINWDKIVTLIFVVSAIIVLLLLVFMMFAMPALRD
ncbi:MAG: hypothetical protein ACP5OA_05680 [Candidatus Woesearchaeota archaeon]